MNAAVGELIRITPALPEHADAQAELFKFVYHGDAASAIPDTEDLTAPMFRAHLERFPQGQFVALNGQGRVIGFTSSMRMGFDPQRPRLAPWWRAIGEGWLTTHDPSGDWLYGVESVVHPAYQGGGVGGKLIEARQQVTRELNLRGMVAGSAIMSYYRVADRVSVEDYVRGVAAGTYFDLNLTKQIKKGFRPLGVISNYIVDPEARGYGVIIVWDNPDYDPARTPRLCQSREYHFQLKAAPVIT